LILGPFQGKVACQTIRFGRGVCGVAAQTKTTQVVGDVEMFPGHIACDAESKSEIVVPVIQNGEVSFCLPLLFFLFFFRTIGLVGRRGVFFLFLLLWCKKRNHFWLIFGVRFGGKNRSSPIRL
jgi:hypothetical protein